MRYYRPIALAAGLAAAFLSSPAVAEQEPPPPQGEATSILDASYGLNCHGQYKMNSGGIPQPRLGSFSVEKNNAFAAMQALCEGKPSCDFVVSPQALGFDPAEYCRKELVLHYRCFSYDRVREKSLKDGDRLTILCAEPKAEVNPVAEKASEKSWWESLFSW